jgi:hypothetical protein
MTKEIYESFLQRECLPADDEYSRKYKRTPEQNNMMLVSLGIT